MPELNVLVLSAGRRVELVDLVRQYGAQLQRSTTVIACDADPSWSAACAAADAAAVAAAVAAAAAAALTVEAAAALAAAEAATAAAAAATATLIATGSRYLHMQTIFQILKIIVLPIAIYSSTCL